MEILYAQTPYGDLFIPPRKLTASKMTPRKNAAKFFMEEQEMLSPIKKGIKLDVSKLNISHFNDSTKNEKQKDRENENIPSNEIKKKKKDSSANVTESINNELKKGKSMKQTSKIALDESSSSAASSFSDRSGTSASTSFNDSSDSELTKKRKQKRKDGKEVEQKEDGNGKRREREDKGEKAEIIAGKKTKSGRTVQELNLKEEKGKKETKEPTEETNKRKLSKEASRINGEMIKKQKTKNVDIEIPKDKKKRKNLIEEDEDDDDDDEDDDEAEEKISETGNTSVKYAKSIKNTDRVINTKTDTEEFSRKDTLRKRPTKSNIHTGSGDLKDIESTESKRRKKQENQEELKKKGQNEKVEKNELASNKTKKNMVKTEEWDNLNLEDCLVEIVEENSCKYEDGTIFESVLVNKVRYSINDNVLAYCRNGKTNGYILRKGKISGIYQNFNHDKVEIEICFYFDYNDEPFIKDLENRQRSRRSKEDFVVFLDEKTKYYHLLGNIEFKIIEANYIKQLIYVYNVKRDFEKDVESVTGKDKFLCTYYLKEREDRICEIQNEDHWDNLVLGSSNLYYYFTNNRKKNRNKSIQLIIDKLKVNEAVSTTSTPNEKSSRSNRASVTPQNKDIYSASTPRKAQASTPDKTNRGDKQQKSKTPTNKESAKEKTDLKEAVKRSDTKKTDIKRADTKRGAKNEKGGADIKFDLQNIINEDKEKYYLNLLSAIKDPTDKAIRMMQLDVVPKYLPCREKEIKEVHSFLESGIKQAGSNQILYISGMPGTGKTATVYSVIQLLQMKSKKKLLPEFNVFEINGMNVVHPNAAYQVFYKQLFNKKPPNALNSYKIIDRLFNKTKKDDRNVAILIIDEIDYLITKTQKVLFTFFDWPTKVNSKLVLIAISNTMDLPERLIPRCRSRLAFGRLVFSPYKGDEIEKIIKERLENCKEVMDHTAIQLCARKVANVSGDIRKALQICRKAFENKRGHKIVPRDITEASNQLFDSPLSKAINFLPWAFKIFLTCIIIELRMLNEFIIPFKKVVNRYKTMIETSGKFVGICSDKELFKIMLDKLVKMGILLIRPYIPVEDLSKRSKEALLGFNEPAKKTESKTARTQVSPDIDKESGDMGLEVNVETQLIITALMKDADCSKKLNFFT